MSQGDPRDVPQGNEISEAEAYSRAPRTLLEIGQSLDDRVASLWRAARLGPAAEELRRFVLDGPERQIDPGQFRSLDAIATHEPCSMSDLASTLGIDPSTATRSTQRLHDAGLIVKVRSSTDHRSVLVGLSDAGRETHQFFVDRAFTVYERIFAEFEDTEKELLANYLSRMLAATRQTLATLDEPDREQAP